MTRISFGRYLAAMAVSLTLVPSALLAQGTDGRAPARVITVVGQGTVEARPDVADIVAGVITQEVTARAAIDRNNSAMTALLSALRNAGISDRNIRTRGFSVAPQYSRARHDQPREIIGYQASNQVTVTIREIEKVGEVIDRVVGAGSNSITGVRFSIDNPDALMDEARRKAMAEAKRRAQLLASLAGAEVGRVLRIQEGSPRVPAPRIMMESRAAAAPIAPGTQDVLVSVQVEYELK